MAQAGNDGRWCAQNPDDRMVEEPVDGVVRMMPDGGVAGVQPGERLERPQFLVGRPPRFHSRIHGLAIARCTITSQGAVENCCVLRGRSEFNGELLSALREWRYEPAKAGGKPVSIRYIVQVRIEN